MIIHARNGAENGDHSSILSHSWRLGSNYQVVYDNVLIDAYTINPEKGTGNDVNGIGTPCHEFGNNLGLPDYYDTNYGTSGQGEDLGAWDLMASGCYNNNSYTPAHHNSYSKQQLHWLTIQTIDTTLSHIAIQSLEYDTIAYQYTSPTSGEFFLIENRQNEGFDTYLPGQGLLIYHINGNHHGAWNTDASHQAFDLEEADGTTDHGATDAFPAVNNKFTDVSTPNSYSWANEPTNKPVENIIESNDTIYFDFMHLDKAPVSNFYTFNEKICEGYSISYYENSAYFPDSIKWHFDGGNPEYSDNSFQ